VIVLCILLLATMASGGKSALSQTPAPAAPNPYTQMTDEYLKQSAEGGDSRAQLELGARLLTRGNAPMAERAAEAFKWFRAAADQGNAVAQGNLGQLYNAGLGVAQNKSEAIRLYQLSAAQGHAPAQYYLGRAYLRGDGTVQDFAEARTWLTRAANANHVDAQNELGTMYANGQGLPKDDTEAAKWYRRAADRGQPSGQANLAGLYVGGRGVPRDDLAAYFWYNLAVARWPTSAAAANTRNTVAASRDNLARRLSPEELERAQTLARTWKPGDAVDEPLRRNLPRPTATASTPGMPAVARPGGPLPRLSTGTGVAISLAGHVVTNAHVVNQCREIRARLPGEPTMTAELVATDRLNDLAALKLARPLPHIAAFRSEQNIRQGDSIIVYGFPLAGALSADGNLTLGNVSALSGLANDSRMLQITAPVQVGNSGGPLLDTSGNIAGIVVSKLNTAIVALATGDTPQNVNFAIKTGVVRGFLDANSIPYRTAASNRPQAAPDVGEQARQFTLNIECHR